MVADDVFVADVKRAIRARMRAITRVIGRDPADRARRSEAVCTNLVAVVAAHLGPPIPRVPAQVMGFDPWRTEPDLARFVAWCAARGATMYRPEVDGDDMWAVPDRVDPAMLDVVVVPGLAFTSGGERLGRGRGHYDRFLTGVGPDCLRVGVAFAEQLVDTLPRQPHDIVLDAVVTDR